MRKVSENYKNKLNENALSPKCKIVVDGVEYLGDVIKTFPKISHSATSICGSFPAATLSFEIYDFDNNLNFQDKETEIYKGFVINKKIEYVKQGVFIPRSKNITTNINKKIVTFKDVLDKTQLLEEPYTTKLDWSTGITHTGLEIVQEICTRKNIVLANTDFAFANYKFKQPNIGNKYTDRMVIAAMGEIGGETVLFNSDGNLEIKSQYITNETVPRKRYEKVTREKEIVFNTVVLGKEGMDNDIVYPEKITGERVELKINDNPFVDLYRQEMIIEVAKHIIGMKYAPFSLNNFVDGYLYELNDVIKVTDKSGNKFDAVILDMQPSTRIKSNIKVDDLDKKNTNYNLAGSNKSSINELKFQVDYNRQIIEGLVSKTIDLVDFVHNIGTLEMTSNFETTAFELKIRNACQSFPNKKEFPNKTTFPKGSYLRVTYEDKSYNRYRLPPLTLRGLDGVYDEMNVDSGKISIIKRIGKDESGNLYLLDKEVVTTYDDIPILLKKGKNILQLESFPESILDMTYMLDNLYSDNFATSAEVQALLEIAVGQVMIAVNSKAGTTEVQSLIQAAVNNINLELSKKVDGKDFTKAQLLMKLTDNVSSTELTSDIINLNGVVTANGNFKILKDGSMEAVNGSFKGNVYLADGNKVIGGDGLYTNLHYSSVGEFHTWEQLGFKEKQSADLRTYYYDYQDLSLSFVPPENFKVEHAYITLLTSSIYGMYGVQGVDVKVVAFPKKLRLYKAPNLKIETLNWYDGMEFDYSDSIDTSSLTEINSAFGSRDYTPTNADPGNVISKTSIDLKNYITLGKLNTFIVRTTVSKPATTAIADRFPKDMIDNTGLGKIILDIYGYMKTSK